MIKIPGVFSRVQTKLSSTNPAFGSKFPFVGYPGIRLVKYCDSLYRHRITILRDERDDGCTLVQRPL